MEIVKNIGLVIYVIVCLAIIILATLQSEKSSGASSTIMGGTSGEGNFYDKNKGRTKEGRMKKWTIILGIVFVILSIALGIVWVVAK